MFMASPSLASVWLILFDRQCSKSETVPASLNSAFFWSTKEIVETKAKDQAQTWNGCYETAEKGAQT